MKKFIDGLPEAPGIARRRRNEIGVVLFFGCQDELVVLVAQRLEQGQIRSRVGAFPKVFSMPESRSEGTESRSKPGVGWRLAFGEFGDDWSIFIKQKGKSGVVCN